LAGGQPVYAVDVTTWPRCDAECSPERGLYYHPSRHSAGQPIVAGWAFQWICQLGFAVTPGPRRWTPAGCTLGRHRPDRRWPGPRAAGRLPAGGKLPWFVFDAGYDSAQLSLDLADLPVAVLVRLRSDRCFYADPPPRPPGAGGRPRRHGAKFAFADPATWPAPTTTLHTTDDQDGTVTVHAWAGLHPSSTATRPRQRPATADRARHHPARPGPAGPGPDPAAKVLWLWWAGPGQPDLELAWRAYVRRFDLEIVCAQVTKPRRGAAGGGRDHVADLHLAVGHHYPVDQQLDQLAALLEAGLVQAHP
jgi:DDE superfamily endonuclease